MTASVVNSQNSTGGAGSTISVVLPGSRVNGNLLVLILGFWGDGATPAGLTGWTQKALAPTGSTQMRIAAYTRVIDGSETSPISVTGLTSDDPKTATVLQISNHNGVDVAAAISADADSAGDPRPMPALTTTVADDLILSAAFTEMQNSGDSWSWNSGSAVTDFETPVIGGWYAHQGVRSSVKATVGAITPLTVSITGTSPSLNYGAVNIAIKPAALAPGREQFLAFFGKTGRTQVTDLTGDISEMSFPMLGGMMIGGHNYDEAPYQADIAKLDLAVLAMYNGWNGNGAATAVNQIKAINPNILLANYTIMTEMQSTSDPAQNDVRAKLSAEVGPSGIGDWWAYDAAGQHTDWSGGSFGSWDTNLTLLTTPDSNGDRYPQWLAKRDNTKLITGVDFDIWYSDNNMWQPRSDADWNRDGSNDDADNTTVQNWWRDGQRAYYDTARTLQPNKLLMVNTDNDLDGGYHPEQASPYTQFTGVTHAAFLERLVGMDWSAETWGGWDRMMGWYHRVFQNLLDPAIVLFDCYMGDAPTDYQTLRYAFGACMLDNGHFSASAEYDEVLWYDEFDLAGSSDTKWLGKAIDPPQTTPWQNGVYRRRFENGMVLVNPKDNGSQTVTVGSGYHRFSGSQAPSINNGAAVTTTVTLSDRDGLFLVKD